MDAFQLCFRICHWEGAGKQGGTEISGTHQLLAYADDVNLLGDNIYTIKRNTETLIDVSKEVGLEISVEKTKYMLLSRQQNVGQNRDIKIETRSFENVSQFKYLRTTVTNQSLIQEEMKRRSNSGNACYHSVHNLLSSRLQNAHSLTATELLSLQYRTHKLIKTSRRGQQPTAALSFQVWSSHI
jgi:hypothetical protein